MLCACACVCVCLMQREMRGVLERRYQKAGGSLDCPQFQQLVECFGQHRIPPQVSSVCVCVCTVALYT